MFRTILFAAMLASGAAPATSHFDTRGAPGGVGGSQPTHVDGTDGDGQPVIHRPQLAAENSITSGVGRPMGGAEDQAITYSGRARGSLGPATAPRATGSDEGRPIFDRTR